jgi:hypothetical protein
MDYVRGTSALFKATFVDIDGEPLVSKDPNTYPAVQVKNWEDDLVYSGVGRSIGDGDYVLEWFVPEDAVLNTPPQQYTANWYFTNLHDHTEIREEPFNIVGKIIPDIPEIQQTYITRIGKAERLILPLELEQPAQEVALTIQSEKFTVIKHVCVVADDQKDTLPSVASADRKIGLIVDDGIYKYYYNTDPFTSSGEYPVFWDVRETTVSPEMGYHQAIRVPENQYWLFNKPLLMMIDKLRKRIETFQGYTEDQIYEFVIRGLGFVNGISPATGWTLSSIPPRVHMGVAEAVILSAAKWALITQQTLENELSFDHGGQTVTLGINHDYSGVIGAIDSQLERFAEAKPRIYRLMCRSGVVGVRPYHYSPRTKVWKLSATQSPQDLGSALAAIINTL